MSTDLSLDCERWAHDALFCAPRLYDDAFAFDASDERDRVVRVLGLEPGHRVTVPACGTGRFAEALGAFGCRVEAFDLNPSMIAFASRVRAHPRVVYSVHDMTAWLGAPGADAIVVLCNSFRYLLDAADAERHLRLAYAQLAPGGRYLSDLGLDTDGRHIGVGTRWSLDFGDSIVHARWRLAEISGPLGIDDVEVVRVAPSGATLERVIERQPQRLWSRSDLLGLAQACGFRVNAVLPRDGNRQGGPGRYFVVLDKPA